MQRIDVSDKVLFDVLEAATLSLGKKLEKHGRGAYVSSHESLGFLVEEIKELIDAIHQNDAKATVEEWYDVIVVGLFAVASAINKKETTCTCDQFENAACCNCTKKVQVLRDGEVIGEQG